MRTLKTMLALLLVAAAMAAAVTAASGSGAAAPTAPQTTTPDPPGPQSFAVFRRPAGPADQMPAAVRAQLAPATAGTGVDFDDARAVAASGAGAVWAIPGTKQICLAQPDPVDGFGVNCAPIADALAGRLWVGLDGLPGQSAGDVLLAILVPDGVGAVTAMRGDGATRSVAVSDNVAFDALSSSEAIRFDDAGGAETVAVPGTPKALVAPSP